MNPAPGLLSQQSDEVYRSEGDSIRLEDLDEESKKMKSLKYEK